MVRDHCYVLSTIRSKEEELCRLLNTKDGVFAYSPKIEYYHRVAHEIRLKTLFPGYVFVATKMNRQEIDLLFRTVSLRSPYFKELKFEGVSALTEDEEKILGAFLDDQKILRMSCGCLENRKLHILNGPLTGMDDYIVKYDRHNQLATLNLYFLEQKWIVGVCLVKEKECKM